MAGNMRIASKSLLNMTRSVMNAAVPRQFSVTATILAGKQPPKAKAPPKPPAATPKAATPNAAPTPPPPVISKGDTYMAPVEYNEMSYYNLESDMRKSRLPQPKPGQPC